MIKSEEQYIEQGCKKGDRKSQASLYSKISPRMLSIAIRYLGDKAQAKDLLHDTFLKIFDKIDKFKYTGKNSLYAWCCRIMQNESLQYLRKKKLLLDFDDIKEEQIDTDNSEDDDSFKKVPRDVLFSFISELPNGYRTIFNMYVFEKYSHKQIAKELGVKEKSSASQLVRAKSKLIDKINDYLKKEER